MIDKPPVAETEAQESLAPTALPESRFAAQDPEFMAEYEALAAQNDHMLYRDIHSDVAGIRFFVSEEHMEVLQRQGYEYALLELPRSLNRIFEKFEDGRYTGEDGQIDTEKLRSDLIERLHETRGLSLSEKGGYDSTSATTMPSSPEMADKLIELMVNADAHGIKVRAFDSDSGKSADPFFIKALRGIFEDSKNGHLENERYRMDAAWDRAIEYMTDGAKSALFIGGGHATNDFGIDEFLEQRGRDVAHVRVSGSPFLLKARNDVIDKGENNDLYDLNPDLGYIEQDYELFREHFEKVDLAIMNLEVALEDPSFQRYLDLRFKLREEGLRGEEVAEYDSLRDDNGYEQVIRELRTGMYALSTSINIMPESELKPLQDRLAAVSQKLEGYEEFPDIRDFLRNVERAQKQLAETQDCLDEERLREKMLEYDIKNSPEGFAPPPVFLKPPAEV